MAPSRLQPPISPFTPFALSARGVERQIRAFVNCAVKAREAGYDGVEVMGSEGYFFNQFLSQATNLRTDAWGGDYSHRMGLPVENLARLGEALNVPEPLRLLARPTHAGHAAPALGCRGLAPLPVAYVGMEQSGHFR